MRKPIYILFSILLSACAATTTPAPSATPKAIDSATPELIKTATITVNTTMQRSSTLMLPAPTEDPTEQAYNAQATKEWPTRVARATKIVAEFGVVCYGSEQTEYTSPNRNWVATVCGDKQNAILEIANRQSKRWVLQLKDYIGGGTGPGGFHPEHWSGDEEYLYFTYSLAISGGGYACFYDFGVDGLYRMKLDDGTVTKALPFVYDFAFSPTGRRLAYLDVKGLSIRDLQTGAEMNFDAGENVITLTWSPDGSELAYANCRDDNSYSIKKSTVKIFSIRQNASRTILETGKKQLSIVGWNASNILTIYSECKDNNGCQFEELFLDTNSGRWVTPTATP